MIETLDFTPSAVKRHRDFEAAVWRIDLRLAEMGQKDLLGQLK